MSHQRFGAERPTEARSWIDHLRRVWLPLAIVGFALAAAGDDFEARLPAVAGGELLVNLASGSIEVERHDELTVRVEARIGGWRPDASTFTVTSEGENIRVRGTAGGLLGGLGRKSRVHVRVPEHYSVDIHTNGGRVTVDELRGSVKVRTNGARIEVGQIEGSVELHTSGARIEAREIVGDVMLRTSGARIEVSEVTGAVDAATSGANIEAHDVGGPVSLRTSGGSVSVRFSGAPAGTIQTSGASIEVKIPGSAGAQLDARTSGGRIELDRGFTLEGTLARERITGRLGEGGERLTLQTTGANIRIEAD